ncbi:MAG: hypothetical protein J6Q22_10785 [Prevotella sp.]|nr:hypothetical protein [Prevotella sp.]
MTIKEAFAQAFDEAFVMDAAPSGLSTNSGKASNSNAAKAKGMGSGMAAAAKGAEKSMGPQKSLAEHKQEGCEAEKNGHPERCPYVQRMTKDFEKQGMSHEEAQKKALQEHGSAAITNVSGQPQGEQASASQEVQPHPAQPQPQSPEMLEQQVQQIAQNPQMMEQIPSEMLPETKMVKTEAGELPAQTTVQEGILENLTEQAASGNTIAEASLQELKDKVEDGTITPSPQEEKVPIENSTEPTVEGQTTEQANAVQKISTSDGKSSREITPEESEILTADPEKKNLLQKMVDIESKVGDYKVDGAELKDLANQYQTLQRMFYGEKSVKSEESEVNGQGEQTKTKENIENELEEAEKTYNEAIEAWKNADDNAYYSALENMKEAKKRYDSAKKAKAASEVKPPPNGGGGGSKKLCPICSTPLKVDGTCPKQDEPWHKEGKSGPDKEKPRPAGGGGDEDESLGGGGNDSGGGGGDNNTEEKKESEGVEEGEETTETTESSSHYYNTPSPDDAKFRIGENKYKVGDTVYTDVSGKGLLRTMFSAFMAGLRGEEIITGWDRISGTWDQIKRSQSGEMVRDGITGALIKDKIAGYSSREGLSGDAKMELSVIQDMIENAKSPKDNMAAIKQFQAWKEKYSKELGEMDKPKLGEPFKPLPNDYKGGKPPISILDPPKDFDSDKAFGDHVASVLQESLGAQGLPVGDIESISVGPSATTIEFKVDPSFDITEANGKKVKESLKGALGTPVSKIEYAAGKPHVVAVQVTNLKMRDVSFSSCIASDEWKDFADKAGLPVTLGKDSSGKNVNLDLSKQPHTIVTGESGSGKSVFLMAAINSLEMAKTPDEARLVLLDPKNEFRSQDGSPHLLYPRAQKPQDIANVVSSLKALMDDRIVKIGGAVKDFDPTKNEFQGNSDRNITEYNRLHPDEKMPHVLMTFDEVASIMKNPEVSDRVKQDLSQILALGRSVGINCLLATQRADVASIPGDIKANAPASIAFKAAPDDAKASAAAKGLAGSGDFIMTDKEGKQTRGRGCFISDKEVAAIPAYYRDNMKGAPKPTNGEGDSGGGEGPQLPQEHLDAIAAAVEKGNPISMVAEEGFLDAFKNAFPSDWKITEEEVDGEKRWKASPPKTNSGDQKGNEASSIPTDNLQVKSANASFPTQKELPDGEVEIPIATYAADKGYEWQGRPEGIDIKDLNAIVEAGAGKVRNSDGIIPDSFVVRLNLGNGKVAFMTETLTKSGFDQAGRSSVLNRVAFVDEEMANTNGDKIVNYLLSMPIPEKGSDPSLKDNKIKVKFEGEKKEKNHLESNAPDSSEGIGESSSQETPKEENTDWRKDGSRDEAIATLSKVRDSAKAKAWDTYNKGEDTAEAQKKLQKALEKADADFVNKMGLVDMKFPPPEDESMDGGSTEEDEEGESTTPENNGDDDEDSPAATMKDIEETYNAERERIEKALARPNTKVRDKQKLREERKALKNRFNQAKAKFEAGGSAEDMLDIFEPEEKPKDAGEAESSESPAEPSDAENTETEQQEQVQKDEQLRSTVREQKFYKTPGFKATSKVTPQQIKQMENLLPAGWEFVTDNQFKAPARTKNGVVFIRHPTNGSYGRIFIKTDEKGKEYVEPEAQIDVDTTHPEYQGFVKNEDGTYSLTEEGKKAEAEYKHVRKYSKNEKEREDAQKKFNRIRFGHDEAPDNMTIVANAVAKVLEKL